MRDHPRKYVRPSFSILIVQNDWLDCFSIHSTGHCPDWLMIFIHFQFVHFEEFATKSFDHHHRHVVPIQQLAIIKDISITAGSSFFVLPPSTSERSLACERHIDTYRFPGYIFWTRTSPANRIKSNESFWTTPFTSERSLARTGSLVTYSGQGRVQLIKSSRTSHFGQL
jgi:hypothetical protein